MMENTANIIDRSPAEISFCVDRVEPCPTLLPLQNAKQQFEQRIDNSLLAFSYDDRFEVIESAGNHPLVTAVHLAFSDHHPLLLTPDIIWMTIAQGFAQHINNNAEKYRDRFVSHSGKKQLSVTTNTLNTSEDWRAAIDEWSLQIRDFVGADIYRLMLCNFSTTTPIVETASRVVMMDAFKQYFDYMLYGICGIPSITIQGSIEDWETIRKRIDTLSTYDLDWWTRRLIPICDAFIDTIKGNQPLEFWQNIYKPISAYGGDVITGWLAYLFPYLKDPISRNPIVKNSILDVAINEITVSDGIDPIRIPVGISQVQIVLHTLTRTSALDLVAGFVGVSQNPDTMCLKPEIGWGVCESDLFSKILLNIRENHQTNPPLDWQSIERTDRIRFPEMPKDSIQVLNNFNGANLFEKTSHPWFIRALKDYERAEFSNAKRNNQITRLKNLAEDCDYEVLHFYSQVSIFMDLVDDRSIAFQFVSRDRNLKDGTHQRVREIWVLLSRVVRQPHYFFKDEVPVFIPEQTVVIAKGISQLFSRILDSEGRYYFDDPNFIPDDTFGI